MHLTIHPDSSQIDRALRNCLPLAAPWNGDAFRMAEAPYATQTDILSGAGAARWGGRWNPPGIPTIYACLDIAAAWIEWTAQRRKAGIFNRRHFPLTQITLIASFSRVLDFRNPALLAAFAMPLAPFLAEPHPARIDGDPEIRAQAFGRLAAALLLEALIVPSAQDAALFNLVVYRDNLAPTSTLEIHGREFLLPPKA
jgi:RES domain-containing protein